MAAVVGKALCWGVKDEWLAAPIINLPADSIRVRRRFRNNDWARAFVKTAGGVRHFILTPSEAQSGALEVACEQGANTVAQLYK